MHLLFPVLRSVGPGFLALHVQELGGKEWATGMGSVDVFLRRLHAAAAAAGLPHGLAFLDQETERPEQFTALGSVYLSSDTASTSIFDFEKAAFERLQSGLQVHTQVTTLPTIQRRRFPPEQFPESRRSRKGFTRTRWRHNGQVFDLVNLHLFHNASNLAAHSDPSKYPKLRARGLNYVLESVGDSPERPLFIFGDFNFRLEQSSFIKRYTSGTDKRVSVDSEEDSTVEFMRKNSQICVIRMGKKVFAHEEGGATLAGRWEEYLPDDQETRAFPSLSEVPIRFPPSYPWSEERESHAELMETRPPAWCDRVLTNAAAAALVTSAAAPPIYAPIGLEECMGDHKPVFLAFMPKEPTTVGVCRAEEPAAPLSLCEYSAADRDLLGFLLNYRRLCPNSATLSGAAAGTASAPAPLTTFVFTSEVSPSAFVTVITLRDDRSVEVADGSRFRPQERRARRDSDLSSAYGRHRDVGRVREEASSSQQYSSLITLEGEGGEAEAVFAKPRGPSPLTPLSHIRPAHYRPPPPRARPEQEAAYGMRSNKKSQTEPSVTGDTNGLAVERERRRLRGPRPKSWNSERDWVLLRQDISVHLGTLGLIKAQRRQRLI